MKRAATLLLCLCMILSCCSCSSDKLSDSANTNTSDTLPYGLESYYGDGFLTVLNTLAETDLYLADHVLSRSTLPADGEPIKTNSAIWIPVSSDSEIKTYTALREMIYTTYTEDVAESILSENTAYADIGGKLCINKSEIKNVKVVERSCAELTVIDKTDTQCIFSVAVAPIKSEKASAVTVEMTAVFENGSWHLEKQYFNDDQISV